MQPTKPLTKRQRRLMEGSVKEVDTPTFKTHFRMQRIEPLTSNQSLAMSAYRAGDNLLLVGSAGTGKTFLALAMTLQDIIAGDTPQNKVVIIRSVVPTRDMGFLPGNEAEKTAVYEAPYIGICTELFGRSDAYSILKSKGVLEFTSSSFVRGTTIKDSLVIIDEMQNMTAHELHTIITRIGENSKVFFCGDIRQNDLASKSREKSGFVDFFKVLQSMKEFTPVEFTQADIVRSSLVKSYILAREELEEDGVISPLA